MQSMLSILLLVAAMAFLTASYMLGVTFNDRDGSRSAKWNNRASTVCMIVAAIFANWFVYSL